MSQQVQGQQITKNVFFCPDGKYRWVYEMNLYKNPAVFFLVWKIFFFVILGIFGVMILVDAAGGDLTPEVLLGNLKIMGIVLLVMTAVVGLSSLIYAAMNGGKYCVLFEMDDRGVNHKQMPRQARKAQVVAQIAVLAGLAAGNIGTMGIGFLAARTELYSEFAKVRKVEASQRRGLIKVNGALTHNQVYAEPEDFPFVAQFILDRCPNAQRVAR